jgi:hypothetical protein
MGVNYLGRAQTNPRRKICHFILRHLDNFLNIFLMKVEHGLVAYPGIIARPVSANPRVAFSPAFHKDGMHKIYKTLEKDCVHKIKKFN